MSYIFNTPLKTALDATTSQVAYNEKLNELLGNDRTLSLVKDGVTIYSASMSGPIVLERDSIVDYGYITSVSISSGGNLLSGVCKLRIAGNGNYLEGTAGLDAKAQTAAQVAVPVVYDFMLSANPTASSGLGFSRRIKTQLPKMRQGTGPALPTIDGNAPKRLKIYSYVNGTRALVDSLDFDTPDDTLTFADPEIAGQLGEVLVIKSSKTITFDKFRFGAKLYVGSASNSVDGATPLYRVLVACQPYNQGWDSYPAERNWPAATVYMHPPAFKAELEKADGTVLHVWQGHDGTPINDPSWAQYWGQGAPLRPFWHCAAMLPYVNVSARISSLKDKFYSGVTADSIRPSLAKITYTCNGTEPFLDGYSNLDGYNHMYQMEQWPRERVADYSQAVQDQPLDPFMQYLGANGNHSTFEQVNGWDYEPGSKSGHEYQTGPGGVRFDRSVIPSLYALYATNPNFVRLKGNVPIKRMFDAHALAFFNIPMFYWRDVQNFTGIADNEIVNPDGPGLWNQRNAYYGGTGGKGPDFTVDMRGVGSGNQTSSGALSHNRDVKGNLYWNGWLPDYLHGYKNVGWVALLTNDFMYAIAAKHNFNALSMAQLDEQTDPANDYRYWGNRQYAWRIVARTMAWKLASGREGGHDRTNLENQMRIGLESIYDNWYVPLYEKPITWPGYAITKALGVGCSENANTYQLDGGGLAFYLADAAILMKQTGLWSKMRKTNYKCEKALWFLIEMMDKSSIDQLLDTPAIWEDRYGSGYYEVAVASDGQKVTLADCPTSWADWVNKVFIPAAGPITSGTGDWVTYGDNANKTAERHESMHLRGGWVLNRGTYFPEYVNPRLAAGVAKVQGYYDKIKNRLAPAADFSRTDNDFKYLTPAKGRRLPPSELGPE